MCTNYWGTRLGARKQRLTDRSERSSRPATLHDRAARGHARRPCHDSRLRPWDSSRGAPAAVQRQPHGPTNPAAATVIYTAIGASDGIGFGSSVVCARRSIRTVRQRDRLRADLKARLQADGPIGDLRQPRRPRRGAEPAIRTWRANRPGATSSRRIHRPEHAVVPTTTTHVTIFAGGNDANVIAEAIRAGRGGADVRLHRRAGPSVGERSPRPPASRPQPRAERAHRRANLPNLGAAPVFAGPGAGAQHHAAHRRSGSPTASTPHRRSGVMVVDLMCDARRATAVTFSSDGFHPSDSGYALMAEPPMRCWRATARHARHPPALNGACARFLGHRTRVRLWCYCGFRLHSATRSGGRASSG